MSTSSLTFTITETTSCSKRRKDIRRTILSVHSIQQSRIYIERIVVSNLYTSKVLKYKRIGQIILVLWKVTNNARGATYQSFNAGSRGIVYCNSYEKGNILVRWLAFYIFLKNRLPSPSVFLQRCFFIIVEDNSTAIVSRQAQIERDNNTSAFLEVKPEGKV